LIVSPEELNFDNKLIIRNGSVLDTNGFNIHAETIEFTDEQTAADWAKAFKGHTTILPCDPASRN
jgi:hypothetical protein